MSRNVEVRIDWDAIRNGIHRKKLTAQAALDMDIINDTEKFVPFREGTLNGSVNRSTVIGSGTIVYDTPYARHLYYGTDVRTGNEFSFSTARHPLATSNWFEVAKTAYLSKWVRDVQEAMKR